VKSSSNDATTQGASAGVPRARPFTVPEALAAAEIVWVTTGFPAVVVRVGIVLDLLPGELTPQRGRFAARLGLNRAQLEALELVWTLSDEQVRFSAVLDAVRIVKHGRTSDALDKGTDEPGSGPTRGGNRA
jgi:hypothetical protein